MPFHFTASLFQVRFLFGVAPRLYPMSGNHAASLLYRLIKWGVEVLGATAKHVPQLGFDDRFRYLFIVL